MATCSTCGNDYDMTFQVTTNKGEQYDFDRIECAAAKIAPQCDHCGCTILGHGIQANSTIFCCANCARHAGVEDVSDSTVNA